MRDNQAYATTSHDEAGASLQASKALVRASDPKLRGLAASNLGAFMSDPATAAAGGLLAKLLPRRLRLAIPPGQRRVRGVEPPRPGPLQLQLLTR